MSDDPLRFFANFRYVITPAPILRSTRVTRFAKDVWSVIYTYERMNVGDELVGDVHVSTNQIVSLVGSDRKAVRRALIQLSEIGLLEKTGLVSTTARMRGATAYATRCPEWLTGDATDLLLAGVRRSILVSIDGGVGHDAPPGGGVTPHQGGGGTPHLDQGDQVDGSKLRESDSRATVALDDDASGEPGEHVEVDEMNLDDESTAATATLVEEKERRSSARADRANRRRRALPSEPTEDEMKRPSTREEFGKWRGKADDGSDWSARDVVGYFAARHLEKFGVEAREFEGTPTATRKHYFSNVRKFVDRWFDGDWRRAKAAVDKILARAESLGMPVKLVYFFTPARPAAMNRLDEPSKKTLAPHERNDRRGDHESNKDYWEEQARIAAEKREASGA